MFRGSGPGFTPDRLAASLVVLALVATSCTGSADTSTIPTDPGRGGDSPGTSTLTTDETPTLATVPGGEVSATDTTTDQAPSADLIITGGPILTMDPDAGTVEAVAVAGEMILAAGTADEIARYRGAKTTTVELRGRALLPGFVDPHTHLLSDAGEPILEAEKIALAAGITSLADASVEPELLERLLAEGDALRIRLGLYLTRTDNCGEDLGTWYEEYPPGTMFDHSTFVAGVKIFADGGTCGPVAASEPFISGADIGLPFHALDRLTKMIREADDAGYQVVVHAQGDLAIRDAQSAIGAVLDEGPNELRHRIDHNSIITPDLAARYGELGIIPVVFGTFPTCADIAWTQFWKDNGEDWRALIDSNPGLPIAWHGDDPSLPPVEPLLDLASYVTRADIADDGSLCRPPPWLAETTITVEEGLMMMTRNAAYAIGREAEVGSITPGKLADFVVVAADPTQVEAEDLFNLEVLATYVSGVAEFCRPGYEGLCPESSSETGIVASASKSRAGQGPELALDGLAAEESFWSSGADAPQWFRIDLVESELIESIRFVVFQNPSSETKHQLEILVDGEWVLVRTFEELTETGDVLVWEPEPDVGQISAFRMTTLESLSWPEWYEVEVVVAP